MEGDEDVLSPPPAPDPPPSDLLDSMNIEQSSSSTLKRRMAPEEPNQIKKLITSPDQAVASIQFVYGHPSHVIGTINSYSTDDKGPFIGHVSRSSPDLATGTSIRPIKFGQFLSTHKVENSCKYGVKRVGRNTISVEFLFANDANKFSTTPIFSLCKYTASNRAFNITRMGLVRQVSQISQWTNSSRIWRYLQAVELL